MIISEFLQLSGITHGFFTRGGGHSTGLYAELNCGLGSGDDPDLVKMNREIVARQLTLDASRLVTAFQSHSTEIVTVTEPWDLDKRPKADGLVTNTKNVALGILTADCSPVLFADAEAGVIGAAHAGWKGALNGITEATLAAMEKLGASRHTITAVIGPTISRATYEVGPEFPQPFLQADAANARFFVPSLKADHFMFDLPGYIRERLKREGLSQVHDMALCTYTDEARFFSYRRATHRGDKDFGRLISAISLA
jgi:polyphenol oxidase